MTLYQVVCVGDSLTQGTGPVGTAFSYAQGGRGCWSERVRDLLVNLTGVGPLISPGLRSIWLVFLAGATNSEWTTAGSWTAVVSTDAWDKAPFGHAQYANGSTNVRTYTVPNWNPTWHGFAVDWIDYTNGGNWSYRLTQSGSVGAWTAMGQTLQNDNHYCRFYVTAAMNRGDTIEIRAANTAGTGVGCLPVGIQPFFLAPSTSSGIIWHDLGANGERVHNLVLTTSGNRMAWFGTAPDGAVRLGTGSPIASTPTHVTLMTINDVSLGNTTTYSSDLSTFVGNLIGSPTVGFVSPWECDTGTYDQTQQTNYRSTMSTSAGSLGAKYKSLYVDWSNNGWTGNAAAQAAGLLVDNVHESQAGHVDLTPRFYWFIRNQLLGLGATPVAYPVAGKRAAVVYAAKQAAVQYSAGVPIGIGV